MRGDESGTASSNAGGSIGAIPGKTKNDLSTLDFLQRTALDAQLSSDKILAIARKYKSTVPYPQGQLAASLNIIARMIAGGLPTRVYYASQGGFDTHAGQINTHERLMGEFNDAVSAFVADLKQQGNFDRVLLMTFSEFGRRVQENANGGTDHGAAAPMFVLGGAVKAGLFGKYPSLTDLDHGDLKFNTDFRSVYGTVLDRWLKAPSEIVLGRKFPALGSCLGRGGSPNRPQCQPGSDRLGSIARYLSNCCKIRSQFPRRIFSMSASLNPRSINLRVRFRACE